MKINPSKAAIEDFNFLLTTNLYMIGNLVGIEDVRDNPNGHTALECFYARDTLGKILPCKEINKLQKVERSKQSWNLQIKLWAEDIGILLQQEELVDYCHGLPSWIFKATMKQAMKIVLEREGWIPRYTRLETIYNQWWPAYLDWFDPSI